jgi:hypothetical protein
MESPEMARPLHPGRFRWWVGPVAANGAAHAGLFLVFLLVFRGEPSAFVCADSEKVGAWPFEAVHVGFDAHGFDGQFYYLLALDPWRRHDAAHIDLPALRHSRIVYPALAWLLSGGDPVLLLWVLPAINWAALIVLSYLGAAVARRFGRSPWWGFALPLVLNAGTPALRDLTDTTSILAASGLVASWLLGWRPWALAAWAVAAVLSREQNVVIVGIVLLDALSNRKRGAVAALVAALVIWAAWTCGLRFVYGVWPSVPGSVAVPFEGIAYRLARIRGGRGTGSSPVHILGMGLLFLQLGLTLLMVVRRAPRLPLLIALAGAGLAVVGGVPIYLDLGSYTRVFWWMPFGVWLWSMRTGRSYPIVLLCCASVLPGIALMQAWNTVRAGNVRFIG